MRGLSANRAFRNAKRLIEFAGGVLARHVARERATYTADGFIGETADFLAGHRQRLGVSLRRARVEILFVTPEVEPFVKVGGLADMVGALRRSWRSSATTCGSSARPTVR